MFVLYGSAIFGLDYLDIDLLTDDVNEVYRLAAKNPTNTILVNHPNNTFSLHTDSLDTAPGGTIIEIAVVSPGTAHYLAYQIAINNGPNRTFPLCSFDYHALLSGEQIICVSNAINTALYRAHLILPHPKWTKHMAHFQANFQPEHLTDEQANEVFKLHRAECLLKAKKHPVLKDTKDGFFQPTVGMIFDHDSIHKAIAIGPAPGYTLMQDGQVWCSKKKWNTLTREQQINCIQEEAGVLALERSIIPHLYGKLDYVPPKVIYKYALMKICTTITSGWFRDACILNYNEVVRRLDDYDFVNLFMDGMKNNIVVKL